MNILAHVFIFIAYLIPGRPHRWARRIKAERKEMLRREKFFNIFGRY